MRGSDVKPGERLKGVHFTDDTIAVDLMDGRTIVVPLARYPTLLEATPEQRINWKVSGAGYGIHWPDIDEDLSTEGLFGGHRPLPNRSRSASKLLDSRFSGHLKNAAAQPQADRAATDLIRCEAQVSTKP